MIVEEKHAIRVQNFHEKQIFHDLLAWPMDISVISDVMRQVGGRSPVAATISRVTATA
jgi:hypothetical protein